MTNPRVARSASLCLLVLAACSGQGGWSSASAEDLAARSSQRERAERARDALAKNLLAELSAALAEGGPARGIVVCSERAPALAAQVEREQAVGIGRTSARLRSRHNGAPPWAAAHVAGSATEAAFFVGPEARLGALFPIRLQPQCVQCHGKPEELSTEVRAALLDRYPDDRATGFAAGDLRGWFWVEVPAGGS